MLQLYIFFEELLLLMNNFHVDKAALLKRLFVIYFVYILQMQNALLELCCTCLHCMSVEWMATKQLYCLQNLIACQMH